MSEHKRMTRNTIPLGSDPSTGSARSTAAEGKRDAGYRRLLADLRDGDARATTRDTTRLALLTLAAASQRRAA